MTSIREPRSKRRHALEDTRPVGGVEVADHNRAPRLARPRAAGVPARPARWRDLDPRPAGVDGLDRGVDSGGRYSNPARWRRPDAAGEPLEPADADAEATLDRHDRIQRPRMRWEPPRRQVGEPRERRCARPGRGLRTPLPGGEEQDDPGGNGSRDERRRGETAPAARRGQTPSSAPGPTRLMVRV